MPQVWNSLIHNGFLTKYKTYIPKIKKIKYKQKIYNLSPLAELCLIQFSNIDDSIKDNIFNFNFFNSLKKHLPSEIIDLNSCYLKPFHIKPEYKLCSKLNLEKYKFANINGIKTEVSNFICEPTHIFLGKGNHPLRGSIKFEVAQNDITVNIQKKSQINNRLFKNVIHNNNVAWLAYYKDSLGHTKYMYPKEKYEQDYDKFEMARTLKKKLSKLRKINEEYINSPILKKNQIGCAFWLIDKLSLRIGNEKDSLDVADTYGVCTLLCSHVKIKNNTISVNFIGKDSINCNKSAIANNNVVSALNKCFYKKEKSQQLFDEIDSTKFNRYLNKCLSGLTAKVFRTCNASRKLCSLLNNIDQSTDVIKHFNNSCKKVAVLCNHKTNNTISTSTSKQNYIDPRIIFSYSKRENINIEKLMPNSLINKYNWAYSVDSNFIF